MAEPVTTSIDATISLDGAWAVLSNYFAIADWSSSIDHSSALTAAPAGMSASRRVATSAGVIIENVIDWNPPTAMAYEIVGLPPVVSRVENRWELRPSSVGTSVTLTCIVEPGPKPPMKVAATVIARRIGKVNESLVADLIAAVREAT